MQQPSFRARNVLSRVLGEGQRRVWERKDERRKERVSARKRVSGSVLIRKRAWSGLRRVVQTPKTQGERNERQEVLE
eukprot:2084983-Rhodomonas_salina.1